LTFSDLLPTVIEKTRGKSLHQFMHGLEEQNKEIKKTLIDKNVQEKLLANPVLCILYS